VSVLSADNVEPFQTNLAILISIIELSSFEVAQGLATSIMGMKYSYNKIIGIHKNNFNS
jgi:hypothetical protein